MINDNNNKFLIFFFYVCNLYYLFKIKIMKHLKLSLFTFLLLLLTAKGYSQACAGSNVTITLQNITNPTTTTLEFDVYISNTGSTALLLAAVQGGVIYNTNMLPAGATGTFTCITQPSSTGNFPNFNPLPTVLHTVASRQLRWTSTPVTLASGNTVNLPPNTPLKFARFKFESSIPWTANFAATLTEQYTIASGYTQMAATVYCGGNANSTALSSATAGTIVCHDASNSAYNLTLNGCASAASQTATTPVTCFGGSNGSSTITMTPTPSSTAITYTVDGGTSQNGTLTSGAFTISGLTSGTHTVVISGTGCSNITATGVTISSPTNLVAAGLPSAILCNGGNSTVVVSATGGSTPYTGTGSFTHAAGAYSYTVTDSHGCSSTASGTITQPTVLTASGSPSTILCNGGNSTVVVSATGGTAPYTGTGSFTHAGGAYSYTVTDSNGCSSTASGTITEPNVLTASGSPSAILCNGGNSTVVVSATGGTTPYTGTGSFTHAAGTYSYTVTDANGCSSTTSGTITEPTALTSSTTISTCDNYTWNGTTYTTTGDYTFNSTNTSGCNVLETLHLTINNTTSSETQVACDGYYWHGTVYTASGDYTFNSINTAGCTNVATLHLTINHITTPSFNSVSPICIGTPLSNLPTTSNEGLIGSWLPATMNNNATTTYTFTPAPGQCAAISQMTIQVIPLASAPTASSSQTFNLGDTLTNLIITSGTNLTWYDSQSSTTSIPSSTTLVDGATYYVSQTINGCEGPKTAITVHLNLSIDQNQLVNISYSPNPVVDILVIKSNESIENITVFNTLGQLLFTLTENANEFSVDLSNLPTGSYFIKAQTEDKNQILKVIKK